MAKAKIIPVYTTTRGLNNYVDPSRIFVDLKTGEIELSQAVNVDVDNTGRISVRRGRVQKNATAVRNGYAYNDTCLCVSGTTLYLMSKAYGLTALRTDLTENARMRYFGVADRVYYTNEFEKGYVTKEKDNTWTKGSYTAPGDSRRTFSDPPKGHLLGWFAGRMIVAKDNVLFASEPSFYGVFDFHRGHKLVPSRVTMIQPTPQGLWIGTEQQVLFYRGTKWEELRREPKADYGVLEGSAVWCAGEKLGGSTRALIFTTPQGVCFGGEDGSLTNVTHNKLIFPSGRFASATVSGDRYIVLIDH